MAKENMPFPIGPMDDFQIYLPPEDLVEEVEMVRVNEYNERNRKLAEKFVLPEKQTHISLSFVYGHPADYRGKPMLRATVEDWKKELRRLKEMHIDSVIFQSALWRELNECYYRSKRYSYLKQYPVVDNLLAAALEEDVKVFMGGYGSVAGWSEHFSEEDLMEEMKEHRCCFEELVQYPSIAGFYFPCETSYHDRRLPEKEHRMHSLYKNFSGIVKAHNPDLKIIVSPATSHRPERNAEFKDFWNGILDGSGVDIVMPQDSIGNCCSNLEEIPEQWAAWKEITDQNGITLWSHTELFERRSYYQKVNLHPANPKRVAAQLALTAPFVERHATWEAMYFASEEAGAEGKHLEEFLKTGKL